MSTFENRVSFVTGASSGIGRAMALKLAAEGSVVVCSDINEQGAQATAARAEELGAKQFSVPPIPRVKKRSRKHSRGGPSANRAG